MKLQPLGVIAGMAAAMPEDNIDTDVIFPARFLLLTQREGLGKHAFHDRRYAADGREISRFVLNTAPFRGCPILVAGANFGSGSSREQAVWALHGLGTRVVIAAGLGEIFASNCLRNGMLPIVLPGDTISRLLGAAAAAERFTVDLEAQEIRVAGLPVISFAIAPERRLALLNGWDETDQIINHHEAGIVAFEATQRAIQPWLYHEEPAP